MSELDKIQQLARESRGRWDTVRAVLRVWEDSAKSRELWGRYSPLPKRLGGDGGQEASNLPQIQVAYRRTWAKKPHLWRIEFENSGGFTNLFVGDLAWTEPSNAPSETRITETPDLLELEAIDGTVAYIFDPWLALSQLNCCVLDFTEHAGREVIRLKSQGNEDSWDAVIGAYADVYEFLLDVERGTMLRVSASYEGKEFMISEVLDIAFDEEFSDGLFTNETIS